MLAYLRLGFFRPIPQNDSQNNHMIKILILLLLSLLPNLLRAAPTQELKEYSLIDSLPQLSKQIGRLTRIYLDPALRSRENRFALKLTEGRIKYISEDYRSATQILLELTETYESKGDLLYKEALFYLADSLYHIGNLKSASARLKELLSYGPSTARACALGRLLEISVTLKNPLQAKQYQDEALREAKKSPDPHIFYQLGKYSFEIEKYQEAQMIWARITEGSSIYPQTLFLIGVAYLKLGQLNEALLQFQKLKTLDLDKLKHTWEEEEGEELSLGEQQDKIQALNREESNLTRCIFRSKQEQIAHVKGWDQVVAEAGLAIARIYYEQGLFDDSTQAYLEVPRGSTSFRQSIEEIVWVAIKQGRYKEALQRLDIQLIDEPDMLNNPNTRLLQGRLMSTLERFEDARSLFQEIRHRFELLKSRDIAPIMRKAKGQLALYFQKLIQKGNQALNLESLIPQAAKSLIDREYSSSAARSLFVELSALDRDIALAKDDIKLLKWVLEAPNRSELFPKIYEGLLKAIELRSLLFTVQRQINEQQSQDVTHPELKNLRKQIDQARIALRNVPVTAYDFKTVEQNVEDQLLSSDLTLSKINLTLRNLDSQLIALKLYLKDLRGDEIGKIFTIQERSSLIESVQKEEQRTSKLREIARTIKDTIHKTQLRVGLFDQAFMLDEKLRQNLYQALNAESQWLINHQKLDPQLLQRLKRLHDIIDDFQNRSLNLVNQNSIELKNQLLIEERNVARHEKKLVKLTLLAQTLAGQIAAQAFYKVLQVINSYLLESDAGLLDVTWSQKAQRSELLSEEHKRRRTHLKVLQRDLIDAPL